MTPASKFVIQPCSFFLDDVKEWSGPFFDAHQLGIRFKFDVDVKILLNFDVDDTNVKTALRFLLSDEGHTEHNFPC